MDIERVAGRRAARAGCHGPVAAREIERIAGIAVHAQDRSKTIVAAGTDAVRVERACFEVGDDVAGVDGDGGAHAAIQADGLDILDLAVVDRGEVDAGRAAGIEHIARRAGLRIEQVRAAAIDVVGAAPDQRVLAGTAAEDVGIGVVAAVEHVVARAAGKRVDAGAAVQHVGKIAAEQGIVALAAIERVLALLAVERIVAGTAVHQVVAEAALDGIDPAMGVDGVVGVIADDEVVAVGGIERRRAGHHGRRRDGDGDRRARRVAEEAVLDGVVEGIGMAAAAGRGGIAEVARHLVDDEDAVVGLHLIAGGGHGQEFGGGVGVDHGADAGDRRIAETVLAGIVVGEHVAR